MIKQTDYTVDELKHLKEEVQKLKYDRVDLINQCKNEFNLKQKLDSINELVKELENDYEEIAFMKFIIKLKKLLEENKK